MGEILVLWMLGLIVIAIGWGAVGRITGPMKTLVQSLQTQEWNKWSEVTVAGFLAVAVISIMMAAADRSMGEGAGLPALVIWAGGLWLIPFRFDAVGHYWLSSIAIAVLLMLFWVGSASHSSVRTHVRTEISTQHGQDTSRSVTGLGFLFWITLIGLTVAAIARYTATWNVAALNS